MTRVGKHCVNVKSKTTAKTRSKDIEIPQRQRMKSNEFYHDVGDLKSALKK